jgi:hypothetical protein
MQVLYQPTFGNQNVDLNVFDSNWTKNGDASNVYLVNAGVVTPNQATAFYLTNYTYGSFTGDMSLDVRFKYSSAAIQHLNLGLRGLGTISLVTAVDGSATIGDDSGTVATLAAGAMVNNTFYRFKGKVVGSTVTIYFDNVSKYTGAYAGGAGSGMGLFMETIINDLIWTDETISSGSGKGGNPNLRNLQAL